MYIITEGMKKDVNLKNIRAIYSRFFALAACRSSGNEIKANIDYCLNNGISETELYMPNSDKVFKQDRSEWTIEYWNELGSQLQIDFSKKRLEHMIEVANFLFSINEKYKINKVESDTQNKNIIYTAVGLGIAAIIITFIFLKK